MACQRQDNEAVAAAELIAERGLEGLGDAVSMLINEAMRLERERYLGVLPFERSPERRGYANGYKPKTVKSRVGALELAVPQVREGGFYPSSLERGLRSERALKLALAEMYVSGVSTRKVARVTEQLCGFEVSSTEVSRCAAALDDELSAWRERPLGAYTYVVLDARYEKMRHGGTVVDCAVLLAMGVDAEGKRALLGVSVALSEAEVHWRTFLKDLAARGLHGISLFVSDDHAGLKAARAAVFPSVAWQRCQFHLQQNAGHYVPTRSLKKPVAADIRAIFDAPDEAEAKRLIERFIRTYETKAPKLVQWAETALPQGLAILALPRHHRKRLRTSNAIELVNREIKRRTRVATLFPNEASCLRLVSAVAMEISQDLNMSEDENE
ncbi:IS256 family transposase [Salinisphaera sp. RV14]|uniref:IS256 family transposase n=1 Tax=Salinisphaera sp. RV14 TaxID=3454140 RepID=UPI003F85B3DA